MTQVFREDGTVVPVTRVQAGPCFVTQVRQENGTAKIQIGFGMQKTFRLNKAQQGHVKGINHENGITIKYLRETESDQAMSRGDKFTVTTFTPGEKVKVIGTSKGKGFQGVVKRHGFSGGPRTHGQKHSEREPGSIGGGLRTHVPKGMRMAGRMGGDRITQKNIKVVSVDKENNIMLVKGAIAGKRGTLVEIISR